MARSHEGITQDKKRGTWMVRYRVEAGPTGTRTKRGFRTQAEAKQYRDEQLGKQARPNAIDPRDSAQTVGSVYASWIELYKGLDPDRPLSTIECKLSQWKVSLGPAFADMPLANVTKATIKKWQARRLAEGRKPQSINNEHGTLAMILDHAMDMELTDRNYAREVKRVAKGGLTRKAQPNADTIARLIAAVEPRYLIVLNLALYAGLRSGEARGLRIEHVTRNEDGTCSLDICEQITPRRSIRTTPKGRKVRTVIESGFVADLIDAHIAFYGTGANGEIVTSSRGNALTYSGWTRVWTACKREAGVTLPKGQGAHLLRHAYASYAIDNGASPAEVAANLGHAQVSTTFAYYVHAIDRRPVGASAARQAIEQASERIEQAYHAHAARTDDGGQS